MYCFLTTNNLPTVEEASELTLYQESAMPGLATGRFGGSTPLLDHQLRLNKGKLDGRTLNHVPFLVNFLVLVIN